MRASRGMCREARGAIPSRGPTASGTQDQADGLAGQPTRSASPSLAYTLRLRAACVGNSAETRVPVTVAASLTLVASH